MFRMMPTWLVVSLTALLVVAGCSRSPEAKKARHLDRGDKYFAREQYPEAIIDYRNVLRFDQANARAIRQLALTLYQLGQVGQAFPYLVKSQELDPSDALIRVKLGGIYLVTGKPAVARQQVAA